MPTLKTIALPNRATAFHKRINQNPQWSLEVLAQLKKEDEFGFGVTTEELATRLLSLRLQGKGPVTH